MGSVLTRVTAASPTPSHPSYDPRKLLDPRHQIRTSTPPSKSVSNMARVSPKPSPSGNAPDVSELTVTSDGRTNGSTTMLEGLYGAEKRQDLPQKRKRTEPIVLDDDDDDEMDKQKRRSAARHKGTGIIGEYMKEGKKLALLSNGPVDYTKGP